MNWSASSGLRAAVVGIGIVTCTGCNGPMSPVYKWKDHGNYGRHTFLSVHACQENSDKLTNEAGSPGVSRASDRTGRAPHEYAAPRLRSRRLSSSPDWRAAE